MTIAVTVRRDEGICVICLDPFAAHERQWTHRGGEDHDGFHARCLIGLLNRNLNCPICRQSIDINPASLMSRVDRTRSVLTHSSIAATIGILSASVGLAIAGGIVNKMELETASAEWAGGIAAEVAMMFQIVALIGDIAVGSNEVLRNPLPIFVTLMLGSAIAAGSIVMREGGEGVVAVAAGIGAVIGVIPGNLFLNHFADRAARQNICIGIFVGGISMIVLEGASMQTVSSAVRGASIIAGIATGVLTLLVRNHLRN